MPCSALSAMCLRSSSIQPCRVSTIIASWHRPPFSSATSSSQRRTSGSLPCSRTKRGSSRRAYGNSTSLTKEMLLVVPSMSVRMVVVILCLLPRIARIARMYADQAMGGSASTLSVPLLIRVHPRNPWQEATRSARVLLVARELLRDVGSGEVPDPAVGLLEEADRDEARFRAHVEPVRGAVGHRDQVALDAFDLIDLVAHVQGEQARAVDEEAHLVLVVVVLVEELAAHLFALRVVRRDADHVHAGEAALGRDAVDV